MNKTHQEEAKERIDKYIPIVKGWNLEIGSSEAKKCATLECQSIIDELELVYKTDDCDYPISDLIESRINHHQSIIKAIEQY